MPHIAIISASVRIGRMSHRVALYFKQKIEVDALGSCEILDLNEYQFPIFEERLKYQQHPAANVIEFTDKIKHADGVIIVTPEYNGGYPASIKNVIDLLYDEWHRKPIAIATVSGGPFAGTQVITSLLFTLWKIRAWVVPAMFPVPNVEASFDEHGNAQEATRSGIDKRAAIFLKELLWCIDAKSKMA